MYKFADYIESISLNIQGTQAAFIANPYDEQQRLIFADALEDAGETEATAIMRNADNNIFNTKFVSTNSYGDDDHLHITNYKVKMNNWSSLLKELKNYEVHFVPKIGQAQGKLQPTISRYIPYSIIGQDVFIRQYKQKHYTQSTVNANLGYGAGDIGITSVFLITVNNKPLPEVISRTIDEIIGQ